MGSAHARPSTHATDDSSQRSRQCLGNDDVDVEREFHIPKQEWLIFTAETRLDGGRMSKVV